MGAFAVAALVTKAFVPGRTVFVFPTATVAAVPAGPVCPVAPCAPVGPAGPCGPTLTTSISISGSWLVEMFSLLSKLTEIELPGLAGRPMARFARPRTHARPAPAPAHRADTR